MIFACDSMPTLGNWKKVSFLSTFLSFSKDMKAAMIKIF